MTHWGMVIDLRKCIGCETCKHVCSDVNKSEWRRVVDIVAQGSPEDQKIFIPMGCMHCVAPPCHEVCPTGATGHRSDGIVTIDRKLCVGCGACIMACPYNARKISFEDKISHNNNLLQKNSNAGDRDQIGVCSKCDFCSSHVDAGLNKGLQPGQDPAATPFCVRYCIAEALFFGDLDDPESVVSKLIRENNTSCLNAELGTEPSLYYIIE